MSDFAPAGRVRHWRCARHPEREAAARCPSCGQPFCRECVSEHEGRLLCAACLERLSRPAAPPARARRDWAQPARLLGTAFLLWVVLMLLGTVLARIPPEWHDGREFEDASLPP